MYDCIVVGAGVVGSAAAYDLVKRNCKVLLLEQFGLPHSRGSSHGQTRGYRTSYPEKYYAEMTRDSLPLWRQLEKETGTELFSHAGLLVLQGPPYDVLHQSLATVGEQSNSLMDSQKLNQVFSGRLSVPSDCKGYVEDGAGILKADKALVCFRDQILQHGGHIRDEEKVLEIIPGATVMVKTTKGAYWAKSLIIAVGAWLKEIMKPLGLNIPLEPHRIEVCYWQERIPGTYKNFPNFSENTDGITNLIYGMRSKEYPGMMKICVHWGTPCNPDRRDSHFGHPSTQIPRLQKFVKTYFPGLYDNKPIIVENCMYSFTPDHEFIIDKHFQHQNIIFAGGMSGHGFKMAPITGRILADLALGKSPEYDITTMRLSRFPESRHVSKL